MSLEILGLLFHKDSSESTQLGGGAPLELETIGKMARLYEENDYDRVLILQNSFAADPIPIACYVAAITKRLAFMVAHRPGFIAPTMAARMFATLDHLSQGRAGVHIITGANDIEIQCDGDFLTKEMRYRRSREYVEVMKRIWNATDPVTFDGEFYKFNRALSELRPYHETIPVYWGGSSPDSLEFAGQVADVYAMSALQPLALMREFAESVQASAARAGRKLRLQCSVKMIVGDTEEAAWKQAAEVLEEVRETAAKQQAMRDSGKTAMVPGMRVDDALTTGKGGHGIARQEKLIAGEDDIVDKRLWIGATKASASFATNKIAPTLVGTPEQIVETLADYYDLGITGYLTSGFNMVGDIPLFGKEVIPLMRKMAESRQPKYALAQ
jgi:alkanesulfonate monooxygenase